MLVRDRDLAVEDDGDGPAVLFLHGLGGTSNVYQPQADALADRYRIVRIDSAGAGRSPTVAGISVASHADDALAVLDGLGITRAVVVGHSVGTLVARRLALTHPDRVAGVVLVASVTAPPPPAQQAARQRAATLRAHGTRALAPQIVARSLSTTTRRERPELAAFVRELVMRQDAEGYARNNEALAGAEDPGPPDPAVPLLLVHGADDPLSPPAAAEAIAASHPGARVELLAGVGHWVPVEGARELTSVLERFLPTCRFTPA